MTQLNIDLIVKRFAPCYENYDSCLLVWQRNEFNVGILIDTISSRFMLVRKLPIGYAFCDELSSLFNGYIYEQNNQTVFEFEYLGSKNDHYILNDGCRFSALKTAVLRLQTREFSVLLSFAEDTKKVYYRYSNNTFWSPKRKRYFSFNAKYDPNAVTGRYHRVTDHTASFDRGYFNLDY